MKKAIIISAVIILLILFVPLPGNSYDDGGTREFNALTYKIVKWNKIYDGDLCYNSTRFYFYPESRKTIDELWEEIAPDKEEISEKETTLSVIYPTEEHEETSAAENTDEMKTSEGVIFPPFYTDKNSPTDASTTKPPKQSAQTRPSVKEEPKTKKDTQTKADKEPTSENETEKSTEAFTTDEPYFAWFYGEVKEVHGKTVIVAEYDNNKETNTLYSVDYSKLRNADSLSFAVGDIVTVEYKYPVQETYPVGIVNLLGISHSVWNSGPDQGIDLN